MNRRELIVGLPFLGQLASASKASDQAPGDLKLGVATYSLRRFSRSKAISMLADLGIRYVSIKEFHLPYASSRQELIEGRKEFDQAGLEVLSGGVIVSYKEDDSAVPRYFEYAKACRLPMMIVMPTARQVPIYERLAQEYDIRVAIHNHGPEDANFPTPESAYSVVEDMDRRMGLCIDVGHTARTGANVLESITKCSDRLLDIHMKDLRSLSKHSDCEVGKGVLPIASILKLLRELSFQGNIALEYEAEPEDPLPGMRTSLAYMHGVLAGLNE